MKKIRKPIWQLSDVQQSTFLRQVASPVQLNRIAHERFQQLIDDMVITMYQAKGIGLAAPQIGKSIKLAVIGGEANDQADPIILINPSLSNISHEQIEMEEGCLSIPKTFGNVRRSSALTLTALDRFGKSYTLSADGLLARVIQHEVDHLNGKLFIDRT